jgi:hypothetical protein
VRSHLLVKSVANLSQRRVLFRPTSEFIEEKSHILAAYVANPSLTPVPRGDTAFSTRAKSLFPALSVAYSLLAWTT